jgi:beta-galactosidase
VNREKYSDAKLQATFITSSPAYLEATAQIITRGELADAKELAVTPLKANKTQFLVVR